MGPGEWIGVAAIVVPITGAMLAALIKLAVTQRETAILIRQMQGEISELRDRQARTEQYLFKLPPLAGAGA